MFAKLFETLVRAGLGPRLSSFAWLWMCGQLMTGIANAADKVNWEEEPIRYSTVEPTRNAVAGLQQQLDNGQQQLQYSGSQGYLRSVLQQLKVAEVSQVLVFSKTSLQADKIGPQRPRAIYFNDETYVGYVRDGVLEIATFDADLGMVFYTLDPEPVERPRIIRQANRCLSCHGAARTKGVPGLQVRSVYPDAQGQPVVRAGSFLSNHRSPLAQRWGGWYVTGTHGDQQHLGNYVLTSPTKPKSFENQAGMNVTDLSTRLDMSAYLTHTSDIAALMVLEHQVEAANLLTHALFVTRHATWSAKSGSSGDLIAQQATLRIRQAVKPLVRYWLFDGETPLSSAITSDNRFRTAFEASSGDGPAEVKRLDLSSRLFKSPVSYLVYSQYLDQLPDELQRVLQAELIAAAKELPDPAAAEWLEQNPPHWFEKNGLPFTE